MVSVQPLDASQLRCEYTTTPRTVPDAETLSKQKQTICTDHMIVASWDVDSGWSIPELKPYGPFNLLPTASCLHYAYECFEGLKAYRGHDDKLRMFRTDGNCRRLLMSAERISLPEFDPDELEKLIYSLLSVDDSQIGVAKPTAALLYIIVGHMARMDTPAGGKCLLTNPDNVVRSWVGGFGYAKVGANYGPSLQVTQEAYRQGYHQILWLYGPNGDCTEAGGSNFFVVWKRKNGRKELVTAPCLDLAKERLGGDLEVTEHMFTIGEIQEAALEGRLLEAFAAGTAWFITPISLIHHRGKDIKIPTGPNGTPAEITGKLKGWLSDMMFGGVEYPWARVVAETQ